MTSDSDKLNKLRQAGYYAKGLVYGLIGALAAMAAFGLGGKTTGKGGVVRFLLDLPAGTIIVAIVALGLLCYALWRFYQAAQNPNDSSAISRARFVYSGLLYTLIAISFAMPVISMVFGGGGSSGNNGGGSKKKAALAEMLEKDWGIYLIGGIALILAIQAIFQFYRGYSGKFMDKIDDHPDSRKEYQAVKKSGKFGYMARGVVFGILAFFLVKVISSHSAQAYKGTDGVFNYLLGLSYGPYLMGAVALGLLGYGIFCILVAKNSNMMRA